VRSKETKQRPVYLKQYVNHAKFNPNALCSERSPLKTPGNIKLNTILYWIDTEIQLMQTTALLQ
jgi:hypothetical protein